jgi:hypothetical protein
MEKLGAYETLILFYQTTWRHIQNTVFFIQIVVKTSNICIYTGGGGTGRHSWLRHYTTSRKVTGSNSDEVIGFYNWPDPSSRSMALGSTQPLTEMSTRNFLKGKGRQARKADLTAISEPTV